MEENVQNKILDINTDWPLLKDKLPEDMPEGEKEKLLDAFLSLAVYH